MSLDKLEAFIQLSEHIEKKHDIPFVELRCLPIYPGGVYALFNDKECFYPQAVFSYKEGANILHYRLVSDTNYWCRLKKNDDTVDNKDMSKSLKDECRDIFKEIGYQMQLIPLSERRSVSVILDNVVKLVNIINDETTEEKE